MSAADAPRDDEHVLIIGAGYVGAVAAARLAATGRRVTAVRRTVPTNADAAVFTWLGVDVLDDNDAQRLPTDADVVVFALSPGGREVARYRAVGTEAPRRILEHQSKPPRLALLTTSTAVYDQDDGSWVDEGTPVRPPTATSQELRASELALVGLRDAGMVGEVIALRLGGIYGPGRDRLVRQALAGELACRDDHWTNRIHRDDAAGAIAHLVQQDHARTIGPVCNVVDSSPTLQCEVATWICQQLGVPAPTPSSLDATKPTTRATTSKRVSNARLVSTGWRPSHTDFRSGYAASLTNAGID